MRIRAEQDGETILHWAAAGADSKAFGCRGHPDVCRAILGDNGGDAVARDLVDAWTKDGNSVLMWAAWSGSLLVVRLLLSCHRVSASVRNRNRCTVAH